MAISITAELKATTTEFMAKMREAQGEVRKLGTESAGHLQKFQAVGKAALLGVAGAAASVGVVSLEMADTFEKAQARLEGAITNTGGSFEEYKGQIDAANRKLEGFGFTNADTADSLATLTNATRSPAKALADMTLAADIARGRNISLQDATGLLAKVETGHVALLGRLGIATKDASGKTITQQAAIAKLSQMYGGDAKRNAETFAGKQQVLKAQLQDVGARIGMWLIPKLEALIGVITNVVNWFKQHSEVAKTLAIVVGTVVVAAIAAYTAGMIAAGVATVLALSPLELIVLAVVAVGVAIYELYTNWSTVWGYIKQVVLDVWNFIWPYLKTWGPLALVYLAPFLGIPLLIYQYWDQIIGFISGVWNAVWPFLKTWGPVALLVLAPFIAIPLLIWQHFDQIRTFVGNAFSAAWTAIKGWVSPIVGLVNGIWSSIETAAANFLGYIETVAGDIGGAFQWAYDHTIKPIIDTINAAIDQVSGAAQKLSGSSGGGFLGGLESWATGGPLVHRILGATGGIVTRPTLATIGEAGPEAVVPLNRTPGSSPLPLGGGGTTIVVNVAGSVVTQGQLVDGILAGLQRLANDGRKLFPAKAIAS